MTAAALGRGAQRALEARIAELERENAKLTTVRDALIRQVDRSHDFTGNAYKLFQSVAELETSVEKRIQRLARARSEEHTSELQSLMRISYAVFCLKKKHPHSKNQKLSHHHSTKKRNNSITN